MIFAKSMLGLLVASAILVGPVVVDPSDLGLGVLLAHNSPAPLGGSEAQAVASNRCANCHEDGGAEPGTSSNSEARPNLGTLAGVVWGSHKLKLDPFALAQAQHANACDNCHMGIGRAPNSTGRVFGHAIKTAAELVAGQWPSTDVDDHASACVSCHRSSSPIQSLKPDGANGWERRSPGFRGPDASGAKLATWAEHVDSPAPRNRSQEDCRNCHGESRFDKFDWRSIRGIEPPDEQLVSLARELYAAAKPLLQPVRFCNPIDFTYFELWHRGGRRLQHPDSALWPEPAHRRSPEGLAATLFTRFIPQLQRIAASQRNSIEKGKAKAAADLEILIGQILARHEH